MFWISQQAIRVILLFCLVERLVQVEALQCLYCQNVTDVLQCNMTTQCSSGQSCYMTSYQSSQSHTYSLGCIENQKCGSSGGSGVLIGRRQAGHCHECCSSDSCNSALCSHLSPTGCVDDERQDCANLQSLFNICQDVQHAKLVCPKFCDICEIDGGWTSWSNWSSCDVTCGNGRQVRARQCSNPPPAHGGLDCTGNNVENMVCTKEDCPVHGGWSLWSPWGECSSTCDFGMQRRDRSCSNPYPSRFGDHCYGEPRDDRICIMPACADGGWSSWSNWDDCSATCESGLKKRYRTCDNPRPSPMGAFCRGSPEDVQTCNSGSCRDGGWSTWSNWGSCSATCGFGLQKRYRTCDNPRPSPMGAFCHGSLDDVQTCNSGSCHVLASGFSVDRPNNINNGNLTFSNVIYNYGGQFDASTGIFTCAIPGTYLFSVHLVKKRATSRIDYVGCYLYKSGTIIARIFVDPTDDATDNGHAQASTTILTSLVQGQTAYLGNCHDPTLYMESWSVFTGVLLYSEN